MDTHNTLSQIEALSLPPEIREAILTAVRTMPEEEQRMVLEQCVDRLMQYEDDSLAAPAAVLEDFLQSLHAAKHRMRSVGAKVETEDRERGLSDAEANLQQSL